MTRFMWCSTRRTVSFRSSRIFWMKRPSSPTSSWLSPPAGSSSRSSFGPATSARASSTRLSVPNGRPATGRPASSARPTYSSASCACASVSPLRACAPTRTLSSTVIVLNSSTFWNVRAIPRRTIPCTGVFRSVSPSKSTSPSFGVYSRVITLNAVVLPAPLGPISPTIWPSGTSSETPSRATIPPNRRVTFRSESRAIGRRSLFRQSRTWQKTRSDQNGRYSPRS